VTANTWTALTNTPNTVLVGAGLATDGGDIYALRGGGNNFWLFDVEAGTWSSLTNIGQNVGAGSGFVYAEDGLFYATTGAGQNRIYRYDPDANSWTQGTNGILPNTGGDLATDGVRFWVTQGNTTTNFVERFFSSADVTRAATPGNVVAGGGLTYLESPSGVSVNTIAASPDYAALGSSFSVEMTVESTTAAAGVTPSALMVNGGSATCTAPSPASLDLLAETPATFTWNCVVNSLGELTFSATATNGTVDFVSATSNSVLVSPEGQNQYVEWDLGSNQPGSSGVTANSKYFYAFQGDDKLAFWIYNTANNSWNAPLDPADTPAGVTVKEGGALTNDGVRYIYALRGDDTRVFLRYDTTDNIWDDVGIADLPETTDKVVKQGGALVYLNGYVYATLGNTSQQFWRYEVAENEWVQMANAPAAIGEGGALTTNGSNIYALRGDGKKDFYRYSVASDTWTTLAPVAENVKKGGALVFANDAIYAFRGDAKKNFWRYNFAANTWTRLADAPQNVREGGALAYDGTAIYAFRGDGKPDFWSYNIAMNTWSVTPPPNAPANVKWGGALTYLPTGDVSQTRATATPTLVSGESQVVIRMTVTSDNVINGITADTAPTFTATGGATATFSGPTLISPDNNISGAGDPVIYGWIATVTPGAAIGSITFTTTNSLGAQAITNSVIVAPILTYAALVGANPPPVIKNTAILNESGLTFNNVPSNTTETATAGSIGDRVWADLNGDGVQDAGEPGLAGVEVCVYQSDGVTLVGCDTTNAQGDYRVFGLEAGSYVVRTNPATYPAGYQPTTATSLNVTLTAGQQYDDADFGLIPPGTGSIGDYIWLDANSDSVQDAGEAGLPGIAVTLERLVAGEWVQMASTTTDADGGYEFTGLNAGDYRVTVDISSQVTSPYASGSFNLGDVMVPTYDRDGTGTPHVALVSLTPGNLVADDVDFGYNWSGSIGDYVWWDDNRNGLQDEAPLIGIPNARVQLYFDSNNDGLFRPIDDDFEILRVFTDQNGYYLIENLPPGNYIVDVYEDSITTDGIRDVVPTTADNIVVTLVPGNMNVDTADFGYFQGARVAGSVFHDDDRNQLRESDETGVAGITVTLTGTDLSGNPVSETTTTDADGNFIFIVPEGDYTLSYNTSQTTAAGFPDATTDTSFTFTALPGEDWYENTRFDFGVDYAGAIGDQVWLDTNGDGVQDAGEPGLAGVTVQLYDSTGTILLDVQATDVNGNYLFQGLADGTYVVRVIPPDDFTQTYDNFGAQDDNEGRGTVSGGSADLSADFGYEPDLVGGASTVNVSGTVFEDLNGNGSLDLNEPGIPAVSVTVVFTPSGGAPITVVVLVDGNGEYLVTGIPQGSDVSITVNPATLPDPSYQPTSPTVLTITNIQSDTPDQDFGYERILGSIAGTVCEGGGNGICEPGEPPIQGVTITLRYAGPDGIFDFGGDDQIFTAITDENGEYLFTDLLPGFYRVVQTNLPGYASVGDRDMGVNLDLISVTLGLGQNRTGQDFEDTLVTYELTKQRISAPVVAVGGDVVRYAIRITNTSIVTISKVPLTDTFDARYLDFVSVENNGPVPNSQQTVIHKRSLVWDDLTSPEPNGFGQNLGPGESFELILRFQGIGDTTGLEQQPCTGSDTTCNVAIVSGALFDPVGQRDGPPQGPLPPIQDEAPVTIFSTTSVGVVGDGAQFGENGITLRWRVGSQHSILGFHIYREWPDGRRDHLTAEAMLDPAQTHYTDSDQHPHASVDYILEVFDLNGEVTARLTLAQIRSLFLPSVTR
jgi:uncharacterized repeat protein (TIGR01451 family)